MDIAIFKRQVEYTHNSGITVDVNRSQSRVNIIGSDGETIVLLQYEEADKFIDECELLWEELLEVGIDECWLFKAYDYADL